MALTLATDAAVEPLSTQEAKNYLHVDDDDEDEEIDSMVKAARQYAERFTGRSFINTTWNLVLDGFPRIIRPPRPPLSSVTTITYTDQDGTSQVLDPSQYTQDTDSEPGRVLEAYGVAWPTTQSHVNVVTVKYVAGYGSASSNVPQGIIHAVKLLLAHYHENREPFVTGSIVSPVPMSVKSLLWIYRIKEFN